MAGTGAHHHERITDESMATQTATILVTDLVGSTALRADLGEERAESMRSDHDRSLIDAAHANGGTVVKDLGDGVLVMFAGAAEAVAAAVATSATVRPASSRSRTFRRNSGG